MSVGLAVSSAACSQPGSLRWVAGLGGPQLRCLTRTLAAVILFWTFGSFTHACAQGMHDWGMWFGTLLVIGAVAALVFFLIALVRWLKR